MSSPLRSVDPTRTAGRFKRRYARLAATRPARIVSRRIGWKLDRHLLRLSGGRVATTLVFPTAVLETTGAKTGATRRNAVLYFHDVDAPGRPVTIVASHAGDPRHPAWFHNLRAHPDVTFGGIAMRAAVVADDAERTRLWALADNVFPTFAVYRQEAAAIGRTIPIVQLTPRP